MSHPLHFFAGTAASELATSIATLAQSPLATWQLQTFSDGEIRPIIQENIQGSTAVIIQSTYPPATHILELLLLVDAAKQAGARKVRVVAPYMGYLRQDKIHQPGEAYGAALLVKLLSTAGADELLICDPHVPIDRFFDGKVQYATAYPLFEEYITALSLSKLCFVAPDQGAAQRNEYYAHQFKAKLVVCHKVRHQPNEVAQVTLTGDVRGLDVVMIDDMIDTGTTLCTVANLLHQQGARSIRALCTHAILSGSAYELLAHAPLEEIVVTNTIPIKRLHPKIRVLDMAPVLWKSIVGC